MTPCGLLRGCFSERTQPHPVLAQRELTKLMVRYNVCVQVRETFDLKQIDEEEFDA